MFGRMGMACPFPATLPRTSIAFKVEAPSLTAGSGSGYEDSP